MLLVLRLLAVYFATAGTCLWSAHRFISPIRLRVGLFLALAPFLLVGKAMVTGSVYGPIDIAYGGYPLESKRGEMGIFDTRTPLLSDVVSSYIPLQKALRDAAKNGRLPLWNRFSAAGEPLLAFQYPAALDPVGWIGFALPLAQAWTFEMSLRLFLALLCGYLFFRELNCGEPECLLGAIGWAFSDHLIFFLGFSVAAALLPFPLLLLGLRRLARMPGRGAVGLTVVALVLITVGGHPETLLHCVLAGGLFFLFELWFAPKRRRIRALGLSLVAGALALGLTAVVLLPFAEIVPHTQTHVVRNTSFAAARRSVDPVESLRRSARNLWPYVYGVSGRSDTAHGFGLPAGYVGSVFLPLMLLGLPSRRKEKWYFLVCAVLGAGLWARVVGLADLAGKLPLLRISVNEYFVFLAAFGVVGLAALGAESLREPRGWRIGIWLALACAVVVATGFLRFRPRLMELGMSPGYAAHRFLLELLPLAAVVIWLALPRRRQAGSAVLVGIVVIAMIQRGFEAGEVYPTIPSKAFYPPLDLLRSIPKGVPERVAAIGFSLIPNSSALYELEDVRGYEALVLSRLVETYPLWCVEQPIWFNRVDDPQRPFLSFLNVRYFIVGIGFPIPAGWRTVATADSGRVIENPLVIPRVFVPRFVAYIRESSRQIELLGKIQDFGGYGIIERNNAPSADSHAWIPNGEAAARILEYTGQKIRLEVEARDMAHVGTSIPAWPGWRVTVDGEEIATSVYNHAFVGFRVPAGRHEVKLRYWPRGFVDGLLLSGITLLATLFLWLLAKTRAVSARTGEVAP